MIAPGNPRTSHLHLGTSRGEGPKPRLAARLIAPVTAAIARTGGNRVSTPSSPDDGAGSEADRVWIWAMASALRKMSSALVGRSCCRCRASFGSCAP